MMEDLRGEERRLSAEERERERERARERVSVCVCVRERERKTARETDIQRDRWTKRERGRAGAPPAEGIVRRDTDKLVDGTYPSLLIAERNHSLLVVEVVEWTSQVVPPLRCRARREQLRLF